MHLREGLFADVAGAFLIQCRLLAQVLGTRWLEPKRRVHGGFALDAQPRLFDHLAIVLFAGRPIGLAKRLGHFHQVMALGLCHQPREGEQFAPLFLREACQV